MVSSLPSDALRDPHRVLQDFFEESKDEGTDFPERVASYFANIYKDALNEIPVVDTHRPPEKFKDASLVTFRGMIQDTLPPTEMYLSKLSSGACGGWGITDESTSATEFDYANLKECNVMWGVSVPGRSSWSSLEGVEVSAGSSRSSRPHKYPLHAEPHVGLQLKIYDTSKADSLKSTNVHDFVGILIRESLQVADMDPSAEPPVVPTLHVLYSTPVPATVIPRTFPYSPAPSSIEEVRTELISWLANEALGGDHFAAEYVLLCAIARVQSRHPPILPPSMTLSRFPAPPPSASASSSVPPLPTLHPALALLFPTVTSIPLTLPTINTTPFVPTSKDEDLLSGWLQLPRRTLCLLTESGLTAEGGVTERGLRNLHATQNMMKNQVLDYEFPFSSFGFETDVSFVVVAEGRRSTFFETSVNVPFVPRDGAQVGVEGLYKPASAIKLSEPEKVEAFRALVGGSMVGNAKVGEEAAEYIENDFVKERQASAMTADDLILRMQLARLLALSYHVPEVTIDIWKKTRALELDRKAREAAAGVKA
ncbi:hypothetical protein EV122DRAFT_273133 [Schizophyllum commune]